MSANVPRWNSWIQLLFLFPILSCSVSKDTTTAKSDPEIDLKALWETSVLNASNNEERLHRLLQGTYVRYHYKNRAENLMKPWLVNDGQDSVIHHIRPVGDPNKEGYLLVHCLFMTHLPNKPLITYVSKINRITRDSFTITGYPCPELSLEDVVLDRVEQKIDLKKLVGKEQEVSYRYVKEHNQQFRLSTERAEYGFDDDENKAFYQSLGYVNFYVHREDAIFYNKDLKKSSSAINYDVRRYNIDLKALCAPQE